MKFENIFQEKKYITLNILNHFNHLWVEIISKTRKLWATWTVGCSKSYVLTSSINLVIKGNDFTCDSKYQQFPNSKYGKPKRLTNFEVSTVVNIESDLNTELYY